MHLYVSYNNDFGGGHKMLLSWLEESKNKGIDTLTMIRPKSKIKEYLKLKKYNFLEIELGEINKRKSLIYNIFVRIISAFKIYKSIKDKNIKIIHAVDTFSYISILLPALFLRKKVIWTIQDNVHINKVLRFLLSLFCNKITLCANVLMKEFVFFNKKKIEIITNGVKINHSKIDSIENKTKDLEIKTLIRLGFIGRLDKNKNVEQIIKAVNLLYCEDYNLELYIVGSGEEEEALKSLVNKLGMESFVKFYGWVEDTTIFYNKINIFIQVSKSEAFSLSILEALHYGLPCITTDVGDNKIMVEDNFNGFITKLNDSNDTADKIKLLYNNRDLLKKSSINSLEKSKYFKYEKMIDKYFSLYNRL